MATRSLLPFAALLAACGTAASATSLRRDPSPDHVPGVLSFPLYEEEKIEHFYSRRRDLDTDVPILNLSSTSYLIELDIGAPAQSVRVAIDTGSSELWVNPNCELSGSSTQEVVCINNGRYDFSASSSASTSQTTARLRYGKGEAHIRYVADDIALPGSEVNLADVTFGSALNSSDLSMGILGLSFGQDFNLDHPNFVDELRRQNFTNTRAFGVALGSKSEPTNSGLVAFGGVDTRKYSGRLHTSAILPRQNLERLYRYWVQLDGITLNGQAISGSSFPVFFDTGATLSYLPARVIAQLANELDGVQDPESRLWLVPCGQTGSVDFAFGGATIRVSLDEFIWTVQRGICVMGADVGSDGLFLLGDSFLRSAYVVFDIDSLALHFAQYVNCGSNQQAIPAGRNAVAAFVGECEAQQANSASGRGGRGAEAVATAALSVAVMAWLALL